MAREERANQSQKFRIELQHNSQFADADVDIDDDINAIKYKPNDDLKINKVFFFFFF